MKILFITCPIRPVPDNFPPIGALSVMKYARNHGFPDVELYDIDAHRPSFEDALRHICEVKPDLLAISAVVSTAYDFSKKISLGVKAALPDCTVVLGGNLAASAEILLRQAGVDYCVTGEGEVTFVDFLKRLSVTRDKEQFRDVSGLAFLSGNGELITTNYADPLPGSEIYDVDWEDLERSSRLDYYVYPAFDEKKDFVWRDGLHDPRSYEPHRRDKRVATLAVGKGCVARCTFCHRFDKGIRHIPPQTVIDRLKTLIDRYNVGFVDMHIESFGSDRRWLKEFCELLTPLGVLWRAGGVRCRSMDQATLQLVKDSGCVSLTYGFESGSQRMLDVMEKKTSIETNYNAARWTLEAGLYTVAQFVLGMPGETNATVAESMKFARFVYTLVPWLKPSDLSINYAQALPGTPLYEFGRNTGLIGAKLEDEEAYLIEISDQNAADTSSTINFTDAPLLDWLSWRPRIVLAANLAYVRKFGLDTMIRVLNGDDSFPTKGGQAWIAMASSKRLSDSEVRRLKLRYLVKFIPRIICYSNPVLAGLAAIRPALADEAKRQGRPLGMKAFGVTARLLWKWISWHWADMRKSRRGEGTFDHSLRKIVKERFAPLPSDTPGMAPLREGR